jgi:hypothetical protein
LPDWFVLVLFGVPGIALTIAELRNLEGARASRTWPTTRGVIEDVDSHPGTTELGDGMAAVTYRYEVDGQTYRSQRLDYTGAYGAYGFSAAGAVRMYELRQRRGTSITVYYDPAAPERSVISPGTSVGLYLRLALGIVLVVAAVALVSI